MKTYIIIDTILNAVRAAQYLLVYPFQALHPYNNEKYKAGLPWC